MEQRRLVSAQRKLKQGVFEISDSDELMGNLASLLAEKKMKCDSLEFGMLASLVRKVTKKVKKGEKNYVGKKERQYFNIASKEGLIEFFTGLRLDRDPGLSVSVMGHEITREKETKLIKRGPKREEERVKSSSYAVGKQSHANAERKLDAAMLKQFNLEHPCAPQWE